MAGVFVRGLTGNKVNVFIDGVRFSNGAQRGGVNTFLDLIDPDHARGHRSAARHVERAVRQRRARRQRAVPVEGAGAVVDRQADVQRHGHGRRRVGAHRRHRQRLARRYARERFSLFGSIAQRKTGDYQPGGGEDSHAAVTRFLGVPSSDALSRRGCRTPASRRPRTQLRANWVPSSNILVVANYLRTRQDGANRWDQMLGGDGNLIAELNDLQLDLAYVRVETSEGRLVRPRVGHLLVQHAARRTREPGRPGQPDRHDHAPAGAHDGQRRAGQPRASSCRRASRCSSAATTTSRSSRRSRRTSTR